MRSPGRSPVLVLVDLQEDFLARPGLEPRRAELIARAARLLEGWRARGLPVVHAHTLASEERRLPHHARSGARVCIEGSAGARPPAPLAPLAGELVVAKRFYGAFGAPELEAHLARLGADSLVIAGAYLHACVRETALGAYERGFAVCIADDAVASTEPVHAELTREWLSARAARFAPTASILAEAGEGQDARVPADAPRAFAAWIEHEPLSADGELALAHRAADPEEVARLHRASGDEGVALVHRAPGDARVVLALVPEASSAHVERAADSCARAAESWRRTSPAARAGVLRTWAEHLAARADELVARIAREVGKPVTQARDELLRALGHVESAARLAESPELEPVAERVLARRAPRGVVALITPWNNPLALPASKLAASIALGNAVLWKPAPEASGVSRALLETLAEAGLPPGVANAVNGGADAARRAIRAHAVSAVALTGSTRAGRTAAALCAARGIPLQAELGGNNARIVLCDADVEALAAGHALAAFAYAGQRCTATRRFVVERGIEERFTRAFTDAVRALAVGAPEERGTVVGPLISRAKRDAVVELLERAVGAGGDVLVGGEAPRGALEHGAYLAPAVVTGLAPDAELVQEETFGPVAVIQVARDLDDALRLANGVAQGLVAGIATDDARAQRRFLEAIEAGIAHLAPGPLAVHAEAPFGGWKDSGLGPPEHGRWDADFHARVQAVYGATEDELAC